MPTPSPQSSQVGWWRAGRAAPMPNGVAATAPMATARLSRSRGGAAALRRHVGEPVADEHVEHEADAVRGCEEQPDRRAGDADLDEQRDAGDGEGERERVAAGAGAVRREGDDAEELDAGDGRQRQPVEGEVEGGVHGREDAAERDDEQALLAAGRAPDGPRWAQQREHQRGRGHPKPCHTHRVQVGEEEHRERRPEVVEGRSDHHQAAADRGRVSEWGGGCHRPIVRRMMGMLKEHLKVRTQDHLQIEGKAHARP